MCIRKPIPGRNSKGSTGASRRRSGGQSPPLPIPSPLHGKDGPRPTAARGRGVYQALRALRQLRQPDFFETWLTRIVLNACHRELRRRRRLAGEEALPESAGPDAYDALPLKEAVRRLPEELRAVVILRYFAGYTQAETARALNIPQGTAATRQRRALQLLRLELGEEGDA